MLNNVKEAQAVEGTYLIRSFLIDAPVASWGGQDHPRAFHDGALLIENGRIADAGPYGAVRRRITAAQIPEYDFRDSFLLPGFVDTHVHFPQLGIIGSMGKPLLQWLRECTLPAEAALDTTARADAAARRFLEALAHNGTTTALVFGSHLPPAQEAFFAAAAGGGRVRIISGLALGDRELPAALLRSADKCYRNSLDLIERWHGHAGLRYALTPRFSVSCSDAVLEVCGALRRQFPDVLVQSHMNENRQEVELVRSQFPGTSDYFETYERHGLVGPGTVYAHNLHPTAAELRRMSAAGVAIAHCPSSNAFLGSGSFPMRAHLEQEVPFAVASDVGGGTGFSLLKEALACYEMQMQRTEGVRLTPATLLHLITAAPARLLGLEAEVGTLDPGKSADFVLLRPLEGSTLAGVIEQIVHRGSDPTAMLGALITLAREESVLRTVVGGRVVYERGAG